MDKTADIGEDGIMQSSSAVTAAGAMTAARWTTAWSTGQPATSHGHQIIAECPGCIAEQGRSHVCGVDNPPPSSTSLDYQVHAKFHHGTVVGPSMNNSSRYGYGELAPSSYAVPSAAPYPYGPSSAASSVHHADYQTYRVAPDRPRCSCGDRACAQFPVHDAYNVGGRPSPSATAQYYGHHVALPPGPPAVYPAHQVVYPGEHFQIVGPPPATHYHHHHRHCCPLPSTAGTHFVPALYGDGLDAASRQMTTAPVGCGETVSSTPIITGESTAAQVINHVDATGEVTRDNADDGEPSTSALHSTSTTSITARHDITVTGASTSASSAVNSTLLNVQSSAGEARVISQSLSALTAAGSSDCVTSGAPPVTSHGGSAELVPVRDVAPAAADTDEAGASEGQFIKRAQHHGSMTFIVDLGDGAGGRDGSSGGSARDLATPLSECLPARLRRKSVQYRTEREDQDEDHDAEMRRKGMSPMMSRKYRDVTEGFGQTSRMAALTPSPAVNRRQNVTKTCTSTSRTAVSSDEDADQSTVGDVVKKRQAASTRRSRSFNTHSTFVREDDGTTRDSDVTSGALQTSVTSSASSKRAQKKRQLAGTEKDIMQKMLFSKPPLPSSQLNEQPGRREQTPEDLKAETKPVAACRTERKQVFNSNGNVVDLVTSDVAVRENKADSDDESNASADTYTIESDKEDLRQERARIDVAFGIVSDDRDQPSTDNSGTHLPYAEVDNDDDDNDDDCSLQINEDSDETDQPRLKRTKNQTLFPKCSASSSRVSKSDAAPLDLSGSVNVSHSLDDADDELAVTLDQEAGRTEWTNRESSVKRLQSEVAGTADDDKLDKFTFTRQNDVSDAAGGDSTVAVDTVLMRNSKADASFGDDDDDRSQSATAALLNSTENCHEVKTMTSLAPEVDREVSNTEDDILRIHESGDELEGVDNGAHNQDRCLNNRKQIKDDVRNSPSGTVGRRMLPAPPKSDVDSHARVTTTAVVPRIVQRRRDAGLKSATVCDGATGAVTYDAPPSRRDAHPRGSDSGQSDETTKTNWTTQMRSLAERKLQVGQRQSGSHDEEPSAQLNVSAPTKTSVKTTVSRTAPLRDLSMNGDGMTRNVMTSTSKQLPAATDHFVPISNGVTTKPNATSSSRPPAVVDQSKTKRPTSGGPSFGGSRSARTPPQQASSPTKDIRATRRSKSNARDEYQRTTTTAAGARTARAGVSDVTRRTVDSGDTTRRHRTRDEVATDVTARQPGSRSTAARQNVPPPATASTRLRSNSQNRPGDVGRQQSIRITQDTTRSQYARSPERGRTSTRQSDVVSRMTDARTSMMGPSNMCRSSSTSVLPTPQRTTSRSPQRPYVPASTLEQERLQNAREALKKRVSYDPLKAAAMGRATATVGRKSSTGCGGSTEHLSPSSTTSRRSSHGSVSELSDEDPFAVAKYSSSVACDINALSVRAGSGCALSTIDDDDDEISTLAYDRILLRSILQMSENVKLCSDRLHYYFRESADNSVSATSVDAKSRRNQANVLRRASDSTLRLEEILHNLSYADRRLQSCTKLCSSIRRLSNTSAP